MIGEIRTVFSTQRCPGPHTFPPPLSLIEMQGGHSLSSIAPYILTHFPGCENSHQGAGRCEEQVAVAAKRFLGPLSHSLW